MLEEVDKFNQYEGNERIIYLKERGDNALHILDSIPKEIMASQKNTDYYKLLKNLKKFYKKLGGVQLCLRRKLN